MIKAYLGEEPILEQVQTYMGWKPDDLKFILENAHELVIKTTNDSGGYGMLMGPQSTKDEIAQYLEQVKAEPRNYIAQPLVSLSRSPCFIDGRFEGRHVDLRPFVLVGREGVTIVPGGLTRVALRKGSYVVNSSQGGGSKDTWVLKNSTGMSQSMTSDGRMGQSMGAGC
jgi:uncharacterized circularly permuted ATP-grasp superfamily protein